jgi:hypothetical protein
LENILAQRWWEKINVKILLASTNILKDLRKKDNHSKMLTALAKVQNEEEPC